MGNYKGSVQLISVFSYKFHDTLRKASPEARRKTNKEDSAAETLISIDKLTKVLIFRNKNPLISNCQRNNLDIISARRDLRDCDNVMIGGSQSPHYCEVTALVR